MHTSRDDYLINTLRFVSAKEESQIYGARLPKSMTTSPEEPTRKSMRVKKPAKKYSDGLTASVVIRETLVKSLSKKKEKMTVEKRKGIDLLSEVALTEKAQYEEVLKKSLRDFYKTHPSGSGTVTKITPSATKIKSSITNEGTGVKPGVPDVTEEESTKSEAIKFRINSNLKYGMLHPPLLMGASSRCSIPLSCLLITREKMRVMSFEEILSFPMQFVVKLDLFKWDNQVFIHQAFLEIRNMEGVMNSMEFIRKLQLLCHRTNSFYDFECPNVPWTQLTMFPKANYTPPRRYL
ncbi:hypothetical protein Tco_1422613 [Tanacetum coccineum]